MNITKEFENEGIKDVSVMEYLWFIENIFKENIILTKISDHNLLLIEKEPNKILKYVKVNDSIKKELSEGLIILLRIYCEYIGKPSEIYLWESLFLVIESEIKKKEINKKNFIDVVKILFGFIKRHNRNIDENDSGAFINYPNVDKAIFNIIKEYYNNKDTLYKKESEIFDLFFSEVLVYIMNYNDSAFIGFFYIIKDKLFFDIINYIRISEIYKKEDKLNNLLETICEISGKMEIEGKVSKKTKDEIEKIKKIYAETKKDEILEKQSERLLNYIKNKNKIVKEIKKNIIGQDDIIDNVFQKIQKTILHISNRPTVLFMAGYSGLGKTALGKEVAKTFGGDPLIYNLGNFFDAHTMSTLLGAPAGYVGYDDENMLEKYIKKIEKKRLSNDNKYPIHPVIIFDEVEKANSKIQNAFLELFDEGKMTLLTGKTIDLKDAIIILTSNIGVKTEQNIGFNTISSKEEEKKIEDNEIKTAIKGLLKPEIVNRVDNFYIFNKLSNTNLSNIKKRKIELIINRIIESPILNKINIKINKKELNKIIFNELKNENIDTKNIRLLEKKVEEIITNYILNYDKK